MNTDFINPYRSCMGAHFLLIPSIYILHSNVNEINFVMPCGNKIFTSVAVCGYMIKNRSSEKKSE